VTRFAENEGLAITGEYVEAETGKGTDALDRRPQLASALAAARAAKCSVIVSKLDRLSRDVAFVSGLRAQLFPSSSRSWAVMPIRSCYMAEKERRLISERTPLKRQAAPSSAIRATSRWLDLGAEKCRLPLPTTGQAIRAEGTDATS
jgi:hypothetical protein